MENKEKKASIWVIVIVLFSLTIFASFVYLMESLKNPIFVLYYFVGYIILVSISSYLYKHFENKVFKVAYNVISLPIGLLYLIMSFSFPTIAILGYIISFIVFVLFVPALIVIINDTFMIIDISQSTSVFFLFTSSSIIATVFFKYILKVTDKLSIIRLESSDKMKNLKIKELIHSIITLNNIRLVIYLTFFIFSIIYALKVLENDKLMALTPKDEAILHSFLVYLAFDNIKSNVKEIKFSSINFLIRLLYAGFFKDAEDMEKEDVDKKIDINI